jgi:hypothetical protein
MPLDPFYMATRLYPLTPKIPATPHVAYLGGTIYSASFENLVTTTTKNCKTLNIASCPFEWKGTLTMKGRTVNMSGHRLFWTAGEPCRRISRNTRSARDLLQSGSPQRAHGELAKTSRRSHFRNTVGSWPFKLKRLLSRTLHDAKIQKVEKTFTHVNLLDVDGTVGVQVCLIIFSP